MFVCRQAGENSELSIFEIRVFMGYIKKGITSLELLVVVTVVILLSGMVILYNRRGENVIALYRDQAKIIAVLNRAKSLAVQTFNEAGYAFCGFGAHFEPSGEFFIFRDADCDYSYDKNEEDGGKDEKMINETHKLFSKVNFENWNQLADIVFRPPEPKVFINGASADGSSNLSRTEIVLASGNSKRKIKVNDAGQITAE